MPWSARQKTSGKRQAYESYSASQAHQLLKEMDASVPAEVPIHLIIGNDATHKTEKLKAWLAAPPRYTLRFIPFSASCLSLVERFFSMLSE